MVWLSGGRSPLSQSYSDAFTAIDQDANNELVVVDAADGQSVIGVLQITFIPYITYQGGWRAVVEGVNMIKKHTKPNAAHPQGGIIEKEAPVHISNLNLKDPKTGKATRIGRKLDSENKLVRFSKKSGEEIK